MAIQEKMHDLLLHALRGVQTLCENLLIVGGAIAARKALGTLEASARPQFDTEVRRRVGSRTREEVVA